MPYLRIRLLGIDAPEVSHNGKPGQPFGDEARDYLDDLIGGKSLRVDAYGPDPYKRVLGVISDEQVNVNLLVVAMGYAEVYRGATCVVYWKISRLPKPRRARTGSACGRKWQTTRAHAISGDGCGCQRIDAT